MISDDNVSGLIESLNNEADPNELDEYGQTPLFRVVYNKTPNQLELLKILLNFNANANHQHPDDGATPLYHTKSVDVAECLLSYGADLNSKTKLGHIHLHNAFNIEMAEFFITKGLDVNATSDLGSTPLFSAVYFGFDLVEYLIKKGAKTELQNKNGWTPLICLARTEYANAEDNIELKRICQLLINNGANIRTTDKQKKDAEVHALEAKNEELAEYLKQLKRKHNNMYSA